VTKGITTSVQKYTSEAAGGSFPKGNYVGTLANGGTGIAPFHDFDSKVPSSVKSELDSIKKDIISGKIAISSPSQPH
jgi:basic membrane protein A and related proteins